jgi:hypothetical protein
MRIGSLSRPFVVTARKNEFSRPSAGPVESILWNSPIISATSVVQTALTLVQTPVTTNCWMRPFKNLYIPEIKKRPSQHREMGDVCRSCGEVSIR